MLYITFFFNQLYIRQGYFSMPTPHFFLWAYNSRFDTPPYINTLIYALPSETHGDKFWMECDC